MEPHSPSKNGRYEELSKGHVNTQLVCQGKLSKIDGKAKTHCQKSTTAGPRITNIRRKSYSGFSAPVASTNTARRSCILPPNSIRDQYIRERAKDTTVEESSTVLSPKMQTITKFKKMSALKKKHEVEVNNLEIHHIATFVEAEHPPNVLQAADSVVAASTQRLKEVIEVHTEIPRSSVITGLATSAVIKNRRLSSRPQTMKLEKIPAFKKKSVVEVENAPEIRKIVPFPTVAGPAQKMNEVFEVHTEIPRSSVITGLSTSAVQKNRRLSSKTQTIPKLKINCALNKKKPEDEVENAPQIYKGAQFPIIERSAQQMEEVSEAYTEIPRHSVITDFATPAELINRHLSSKTQTIPKLKTNPALSKKKPEVEIENASEIHEIATIPIIERSAQQMEDVFEVHTEIPRSLVITGLVTSTALKNQPQSASSEDSVKSEYALSRPPPQALNKNSSMPLRRLDATNTSLEDLLGASAVSRRDQRYLRWLRRNLIFSIESTEKTLFSLKQMIKVLENTMENNTFNSMDEKSLMSIAENYFLTDVSKIVTKDTKDTTKIEESVAHVTAREKNIFAVKTEANCDENMAVDLQRNKENTSMIGGKLENEEHNESVKKTRGRPVRSAATGAGPLPKNRDNSFFRIKADLDKTAVRKWLRLS